MPFHTHSPYGWSRLFRLVVLCPYEIGTMAEINGVVLSPEGRLPATVTGVRGHRVTRGLGIAAS